MKTTITNELMLGTYDCIFKAIMLDPENRDYLKEIIQLYNRYIIT